MLFYDTVNLVTALKIDCSMFIFTCSLVSVKRFMQENPPTSPPPEPTLISPAATPPVSSSTFYYPDITPFFPSLRPLSPPSLRFMQSLNTADYRLTFSTPRGCILPNCTVYVGINPNAGDPTYLDFYVTGQAQSWAAVGFSESRNMVSMLYITCNIQSCIMTITLLYKVYTITMCMTTCWS